MLKNEIKTLLEEALKDLVIDVPAITIDYPSDASHGDYTSNIAMQAFGRIPTEREGEYLRKTPVKASNPRELATILADSIQKSEKGKDLFEKVEVAGPGFINFWVKDAMFVQKVANPDSSKGIYAGKKIVVEFAHPNTHKAFHIGHLRNITTGESIIRLLEAVGAEVVRVNYQGDVGMHIAKCLYGIMHNPEFDIKSVGSDIRERVDFLGKAYSAGSKSYEEDEAAQKEIREINKKIYAKDASIWELYEQTRQWSLDYFETIYKRVDSHFDRYYFESEVYETGKQTVLDGLEKGIFEKSDNAIIFPGSKFKLHDRVFITSEGNPTYEGKEMGLGPLQFKENNPDLIMHVVGPEQAGYFQVVFEAMAQLNPETRGKEMHLAYGWVKLKHGKMSSRTGNVVLGEWLLDEVKKKVFEILDTNKSEYSKDDEEEIAESVAVGAVKYSFLKVSTPQEIAFDLEESVSFDGNSGPYIQYTHARTQSVLRKSEGYEAKIETPTSIEPAERELIRLLVRFDEIVEEAALRYSPNTIANYLFELAQAFNLFYQKCPILKQEAPVTQLRLALTDAAGEALKKGLNLLGIKAPEKM